MRWKGVNGEVVPEVDGEDKVVGNQKKGKGELERKLDDFVYYLRLGVCMCVCVCVCACGGV